MHDCPFCMQLRSGVLRLEEEDVIMRPLGQLVEGYLLIVSKGHHISLGGIPEEHHSELERVKEEVKRVLSEHYCIPLFFEHGAAGTNRKGGCCIDHAHLHAVPVGVDVLQELANRFSHSEIRSFADLKARYDKGQHYLFLEEASGRKYIFDIPSVIPSQYIRKVIAQKIGKPERWDWRECWGLDEMIHTLHKLRGKFACPDGINHPQ
jgi:ATP adenylyltransferase